ncbi:MAG: ribosome maturation factor RimM [Gammaproteobacteria bacterium]|nr:MAG: ribosome maturation factor RimM [Gammaproteobacteria bacterium]
MATTSEDFILVGKISGVFGVKGWMKVFSFTDPRKNILAYTPLYISRNGQWVEIKVSGGRVQGKGVVIGLDDIDDPDKVLPLIGSELAIKQSQLKPSTGNDFYWSELIGLAVVNLNDEALGVVDSLLETGKHDILVVKNKEQKTEQLIPFVMEEVIQLIDLDNKIIRVDWELDY